MIPIIPYSHYYWVGGPPKACGSFPKSHAAPFCGSLCRHAIPENGHHLVKPTNEQPQLVILLGLGIK